MGGSNYYNTGMVDAKIIETAEKFIRLIPAELAVKKSFLFGSYAKETEREDSDIDIALVLGNMPDFFEAQIQLRKLRRAIDLRIEPHPIRESDFNSQHPFAFEIQNTGIELMLGM